MKQSILRRRPMTDKKVYNTGETEKDLREKYNYDGSVLRKAQLRMVEMLSFLDKICNENDIKYFIAFGTLLGAVRHGGFIPWDDDMDIYIDAKGLKKLRNIINNGEYPYVVQDYTIDKGFVKYFNVLRDLKSEYVKNEFVHNQRKYHGIQIDLFPYEYGVFEFGKKIVAITMGFNEKYLLGKYKTLSGLLFNITRNAIIPFLKFLSYFKGKKYVSLGYEGVSPGYKYLSCDVFPLKQMKFEGLTVKCPNNSEAILCVDYGVSYNNIPEEIDRNHHKVLDIRFFDNISIR